MRVSPRLSSFLALFFAAILAGGMPARAQSESEGLTVWHVSGPHSEWLKSMSEHYTEETGIAVDLIDVGDRDELFTKLKSSGNQTGIDIVIGPHTLPANVEGGIITNGYCVDETQCGVCFRKDPPEWCKYARARNFGEYAIPGMLINAAYCPDGPCPGCEGNNPPDCCLMKQHALETRIPIDILQVAFASIAEGGPGVIVNGIPAWWQRVQGEDVVELYVHGGFLHANTVRTEEALDFMYRLYDDTEAQTKLYEATKLFPANGAAFEEVVPQDVRDRIMQPIREGKGGYPLCTTCGIVIVEG